MFFLSQTVRHLAEQPYALDDPRALKLEAPVQSVLQPSVVAVQGCATLQECWLISSGQGDILLTESSKPHGKSLHLPVQVWVIPGMTRTSCSLSVTC